RKGERLHSYECPVMVERPLRTLSRLIARVIQRQEEDAYVYDQVGAYKRTWNDLMDHFDDIIRDTEAMFAFDHIYKELEIILKRDLDIAEIIKIYGKVLVNSFAVQNDLLQPIGRAIYLGASIFDHSCIPQAAFTFIGTTIYVKAITDINTTDVREIRISYINEMETTKDRVLNLQANYYFKCDCKRCNEQDDEFWLEVSKWREICDHFDKLNLDAVTLFEKREQFEENNVVAHARDNALDCRRDRFLNHSNDKKLNFVDLLMKGLQSSEQQYATKAIEAIDADERDRLISCSNVLAYYGSKHPRLALKLYLTSIDCKDPVLRQKLLIEAQNIALTILPSLAERQQLIKSSQNTAASSNTFDETESVTPVRRCGTRRSRSASRFESSRTCNSINPIYTTFYPTLLSRVENELKLAQRAIVQPRISYSGSDEISGPPNFDEEPSDFYGVRTKTAILRCKVSRVLDAFFQCSSGKVTRNGHNYVDPQTGVRIIELQLEVTRNEVNEYTKANSLSLSTPGDSRHYECWCSAYGGHQKVLSRKASVQFACK
ncbi:histone-lysine N-methyltransferase SMYD3-like protein, partial [Dinothrombium tinctorium]